MKIAIIGSGVSGLTAAHLLHDEHDITVYEANDYIGGHVNTVSIKELSNTIEVDTGFIVFNDWTYPNFESLISNLDIEVQDSEMSFSSRCETSGYEWSGNGLRGLIFNQSNWYRKYSYNILFDVIRFNKLAKKSLTHLSQNITLDEFLRTHQFSNAFIDHYILPMGAAIWSSCADQIKDYPASSFLNFFFNHGLLNLKNRPQWKTIKNGAKQYVKKLCEPFRDKILLNSPVEGITRSNLGVVIHCRGANPISYDHVFIACHSDQALKLLQTPTSLEEKILGNIKYQSNSATLHTDPSYMPSRKRAWSAWNYYIPSEASDTVIVTYYMNRLQKLNTSTDYFVTLNYEENINPKNIVRSIHYSHPIFNQAAINAQNRLLSINGDNNTWYCGAYWRNGFHEDGVWSSIQSVNQFREKTNNEQLYLQRAS